MQECWYCSSRVEELKEPKAQQEIPMRVRDTLLVILSRLCGLSPGRSQFKKALMAHRENSVTLLTESVGVQINNFLSRIC